MRTVPNQAVTDLRSGWQTLHDIDKATLIVNILAAGMSRRALARAMGCGEATIRNLVLLAQALPAEKDQLRAGELTTRAALRRIRLRRTAAKVIQRGAVARDAEREARRHCDRVLRWVQAERLPPAYAEQAVEEARLQLVLAEQSGGLPQDAAPKGLATDEIIRRYRPEPPSEDVHILAWYALWLARWSFYAVADSATRLQGLQYAAGNLPAR